jgi:hypothetical protein
LVNGFATEGNEKERGRKRKKPSVFTYFPLFGVRSLPLQGFPNF